MEHRRARTLAIIAGAVVLVACGVIYFAITPPPGGAPEGHTDALGVVPASTTLVVTVDVSILAERTFEALCDLWATEVDDAETREALAAYFIDRLGVDLREVTSATFFDVDGDVALLLLGDGTFSPPDGRTKSSGGKTLTRVGGGAWILPVDRGVVIGDDDALEVLAAGGPTLAETDAGARHLALAKETGGGVVVATWVPATSMQKGMEGVLGGATVDGAAAVLRADGEILGLAMADAAGRKALLARWDDFEAELRSQVDAAHADLDSLDLLEGPFVILAHHHLDAILERLSLEEDGETVRLEVPMRDSLTASLAATLVAAVGVPSFVKKSRKPQTRPAVDQLDKIHRGAVDYFTTPRINPMGELLPCQFPGSVPETPGAATWDHPTWAALHVAIDGPHDFVYRFDADGTGADATFTVTAHGDLDGDGERSTFQRFGKGATDDWNDCTVENGSALYIYQETE